MVSRVDPRHYALWEALSSPYPLTRLGALVRTEPDYGLSARAVERRFAEEPRYIRITDFGEDGIAPGHTFVTPEVAESGYDLAAGDILFARTGSVGKTYIHEDTSEPAIFAGYCIRFQFDAARALPRFVYWWTKTAAYARWVEAIRRPSVQSNINKEEFKSCLIPLPPVERQSELAAKMAVARAERRDKLAAADELLAGLDDLILDALGVKRPAKVNQRVFAVKQRAIEGRFDAKYYALRPLLESSFPVVELRNLVWAEPDYGLSSRAAARKSQDEPRYIRITDFGDDGIAPGHEFATPDPVDWDYTLSRYDLLFARTGSVGKTYLHEDVSEPAIFAGYCIRFRFDTAKVSPKFVYWWTKTSAYSRWVAAIQRPSVQANINKEEFKRCPIPLPPLPEQERLIAEIESIRETARRLRSEAESGWQAAKEWFEGEVLGDG